jgi:nicotinamide riboside kinase
VQREEEALAARPDLLVLDTDILVIAIWWDMRFGPRPVWLRKLLGRRAARHYLLLYPDLPWQPDRLRESPHGRFALYARYLDALQFDEFAFDVIRGMGADRLAGALAALPFSATR